MHLGDESNDSKRMKSGAGRVMVQFGFSRVNESAKLNLAPAAPGS